MQIKNKTVKNILVTDDIRLAAAKIAKDFFPYQPKYISAVTGTNGKTSVVNFLYEIWKKNNINGASFGTLGIKYKNVNKRTKLTTLDAINLHRELDNLKNKKINFLAMEASSHALEQKRMDKVKVKYALFTNLSRDHLDYHKDMKKYFFNILGPMRNRHRVFFVTVEIGRRSRAIVFFMLF